MSTYKIKFFDSDHREIHEGDWLRISCGNTVILYTKFCIFEGLPVMSRFAFRRVERIDSLPDGAKECYGDDMKGIYYLDDDTTDDPIDDKYRMSYVYFENERECMEITE